MARYNFCERCEAEFKEVYRKEFKNDYILKELATSFSCNRQYQGHDEQVRTCLMRLTEALTQYINSPYFYRRHHIDPKLQ